MALPQGTFVSWFELLPEWWAYSTDLGPLSPIVFHAGFPFVLEYVIALLYGAICIEFVSFIHVL